MISILLIDIISRTPKSLQEATVALDRAARMMGLEINQAKTKYMICGTKKKYVVCPKSKCTDFPMYELAM